MGALSRCTSPSDEIANGILFPTVLSAINVAAVKVYGEAEFWFSTGKITLIFMMFFFTFITMVGGNPQHDAYGFRYWNNPGSFAEYITKGSLGRFEGLLGAVWSAGFTECGPEYISIIAGEAQYPRKYMKRAFTTTYWRFGIFYIGGALCIGIILPYTNPKVVAVATGESSSSTGAASPYVIAMTNMGVSVLPHITNALLLTSIFSAGNAYVFCASRSLYTLADNGHAPRFFTKCTKSGVPIYSLLVTVAFSFLSFLCVSNGSAQALTWLSNIVTGAQIIDYVIMSIVYLHFYYACNSQGLDRKTLPYCGWAQPYCGYIGLVWMTFVVCTYGYPNFLPGRWSISDFFTHYAMIFVNVVAYAAWKLLKRTKHIKPHEADLVWERPSIDAYEAAFLETHKSSHLWVEILDFLRLRKKASVKGDNS